VLSSCSIKPSVTVTFTVSHESIKLPTINAKIFVILYAVLFTDSIKDSNRPPNNTRTLFDQIVIAENNTVWHKIHEFVDAEAH